MTGTKLDRNEEKYRRVIAKRGRGILFIGPVDHDRPLAGSKKAMLDCFTEGVDFELDRKMNSS